ncbi:MAG: 4Fe-4S dicluster domain-containing protein [Clostridiales bacterium]|nr:4Fe-4S dicluster domain-containing protein [Clostridiales bacterium]
MQIGDMLSDRIKELLTSGKADRVFAWETGELVFDRSPRVFSKGLKGFVCDDFCIQNLCKYMIEETKKDGKILVLLKPCDTRGLELLKKENRIKRDKIYALGVPCGGMADGEKIKNLGIKGILSVRDGGDVFVIETAEGEKTVDKSDVTADKCLSCQSKEHIDCDEVFMPEKSKDTAVIDRFVQVEEIEKMTEDERFSFWRSQLSKCIRCNACRNVCPACSCEKCIFDNDNSGMASKANADDFEESLYHIIRSFHVCGRCVDCGECSRVCPQNIPLHLINRKYIKDISMLYGSEDKPALLTFDKNDPEPDFLSGRGI